MSKFFSRIGTTASKFMVELHLTKVELNLIQQCRISLTLKRGIEKNKRVSYLSIGDHIVETKNALALEKGQAKFDEKLVIPATLYHEKKKGIYMKKEVRRKVFNSMRIND